MAQINEWLSIDKANGSGDATITLTASSSTELTERMASLEIRGVTKSVYINITQNAYVAPSKNNDYFWVKLEESGDIQGLRTTFEYSYDLTNWNSCPTTLSVPADTYVWFRNTSSILNAENTSAILFTQRGSIGGDLSSMGDMRESNFRLLFNYNNYLTDASELILPWNTLAESCYSSMFQLCESLITAPVLPATTLATDCYDYMFRGCTSLTTAPSLPATELGWSCYSGMFENCHSLTTAPALPATTLVDYCYQYMFRNCTSLTTTPSLPATTLTTDCYRYMFDGCTGLTTISQIGAIAIGYPGNYMFRNCTSLTEFEVGEWVTNMSSNGMFNGCTNLKTIIAHPSIAPTIRSDTFEGIAEDGTLIYPTGSDYSSWLSTNSYYLGYYGWNETESGGGNEEGDEYFWVKLEEDGEISGLVKNTIQYSYDRENWLDFPTRSSITVPANTYVWIKNTDEKLNNGYYNDINKILFSTRGSVGGDLSSMGSMQNENFYAFFSNNTGLIDASKLILPWDVLSDNCFQRMFNACTSLETAPNLPATTLAEDCYSAMFQGCSSLITAPELPATTLANSCYDWMFKDCTSLAFPPELPATTLGSHSYYYMFQNCTSLVYAPELPATTLRSICYYGMFYGCTSLVYAPELPATTLKEKCYEYMFCGCTNLNYIKILATDNVTNYYTDNWVKGVSPTGTFIKKQGATYGSGEDGIPRGWTIQNIA